MNYLTISSSTSKNSLFFLLCFIAFFITIASNGHWWWWWRWSLILALSSSFDQFPNLLFLCLHPFRSLIFDFDLKAQSLTEVQRWMSAPVGLYNIHKTMMMNWLTFNKNHCRDHSNQQNFWYLMSLSLHHNSTVTISLSSTMDTSFWTKLNINSPW